MPGCPFIGRPGSFPLFHLMIDKLKRLVNNKTGEKSRWMSTSSWPSSYGSSSLLFKRDRIVAEWTRAETAIFDLLFHRFRSMSSGRIISCLLACPTSLKILFNWLHEDACSRRNEAGDKRWGWYSGSSLCRKSTWDNMISMFANVQSTDYESSVSREATLESWIDNHAGHLRLSASTSIPCRGT